LITLAFQAPKGRLIITGLICDIHVVNTAHEHRIMASGEPDSIHILSHSSSIIDLLRFLKTTCWQGNCSAPLASAEFLDLEGAALLDLLPGQCLIFVDMHFIWTAGGSLTWIDGLYLRHKRTGRNGAGQADQYTHGLIGVDWTAAAALYLTAVIMQVLHNLDHACEQVTYSRCV
jgi:hypothetical protein